MLLRRTEIWLLIVIVVVMSPVPSFGMPNPSPDSRRGLPAALALPFNQVPGVKDAPAFGENRAIGTSASGSEFPTFLMAGGVSPYNGASLPSESVEVPDETPPGTKVPEPASLMLVGTALLALARAARMRKPIWKFTRSATPEIGCAVSHGTLNVKLRTY